ncbi:MAG: GLPGLI family protein [Chitinophagaceae bacterium]
MKKLLLIQFVILFATVSNAQTVFIDRGRIEFERKTNVHRLNFTGETGSWVEGFKKMIPQFRSDYFNLVFTPGKTLYNPGRESDNRQMDQFFSNPALDNTVYTDLNSAITTSNKSVFEAKFLLTDSIVRRQWRIEPETRTIAGFECRKAVTTICDSVVVVAFYTDQITTAGGPESFSGLPGMILGLAIPRLYTTWFATRVETITTTDESKIQPPTRGKKANTVDMTATIMAGIKNWGTKYIDRSIWSVTL